MAPAGAAIVAAVGDIKSKSLTANVVNQAIAALGGLDVLVNSAGFLAEIPVEDVDQEHWDSTIDTNLAGTFFCSQAALPALKKSRGAIVNIASDAGIVGYPMCAVYSAAKAGVVNLTRAMVLELAQQLRINVICPGYVNTEMVQQVAEASGDKAKYLRVANERSPMKRMARPQEVADLILYLASEQASFVNGAVVPIDGGGVCGF